MPNISFFENNNKKNHIKTAESQRQKENLERNHRIKNFTYRGIE